MLNHSRPYVRKKVVLVLYKLFLKFPEALRLSFPRLKEKIDDPDPCMLNLIFCMIFKIINNYFFFIILQSGCMCCCKCNM